MISLDPVVEPVPPLKHITLFSEGPRYSQIDITRLIESVRRLHGNECLKEVMVYSGGEDVWRDSVCARIGGKYTSVNFVVSQIDEVFENY